MNIIVIGFKELKNIGRYEHREIEAKAQVEEGETPEEAMKKLRDYVWTQMEEARRAVYYAEQEHQKAEEERLVETGDQMPF